MHNVTVICPAKISVPEVAKQAVLINLTYYSLRADSTVSAEERKVEESSLKLPVESAQRRPIPYFEFSDFVKPSGIGCTI